MQIYIEYLILDNMIIDYIILLLSSKLLKISITKFRLLLGASIGTIIAFIYPYIELHGVFLFIFKLLAGVLIMLVVLKSNQLIHFTKFYLTFLMMTFVMGGVCFGVMFALTGEMKLSSSDFPIGIVLLIVLVWYKYLVKLIKAIQKKQSFATYIYQLELVLKSKKICLNAYLDTGNLLIDSITNKPIIIVNFGKVIDDFSLDEVRIILCGNQNETICDSHYESFSAMSTNGKMIILRPKLALIKDLSKDISDKVMVALSIKPLTKSGEFDALIGPKILS